MAKNFGVKFEDSFAAMYQYDRIERNIHPMGFLKEDIKLYIHPASLSVLEPQVGDMYSYVSKRGDEWLEIVDNIRDTQWEAVGGNIHDKGEIIKIIQRNNKPFIYPEVEDDNKA